MRKLKLYGLIIIALLALLILTKMQIVKKYLPYALTLIVGFAGGWFLKPSKSVAPQVVCESEIVYRDTCIENHVIANVTQTIETKQDYAVKKGKQVYKEVEAVVTAVEKKDSVYTTVLEKSFDYGLVKLRIKVPVKANSPATGKIQLDYQLDTTILKEMTTVTNTVVVDKGTDDSKTVQYLPVESSKTNFGVSGGLVYTDRLFYQAGAQVSLGSLEIGLNKFIKQPGGNITLSVPLFKIKK